jgi:putative oxidoreductase
MNQTECQSCAKWANPLALVARVLLAAMFVLAGTSKIGGFSGTVSFIASVGLPMPSLLAVLTVVLEIVGGIALIVGYRTRLFAFLLAGFTLLAAFIFHAFWSLPADQAYVQNLLFMKNLSIAGGLLLLTALGGGDWSLDSKLHQVQ